MSESPGAAKRVLIQFAHPVLERSRVNAPLLAAVRDLPGVTVNDLYEEYPALFINVAREQRLLREHDVVVFQHPFFWYSTPAILKQWQDMVLEHGWAYGPGGRELVGKITFNVLSTGGPASAYRREGYNRYTVRELLAPWEQTASLCGMRYLAPYVAHGALRSIDQLGLDEHCAAYRKLIEAVRDDRLDLERAAAAEQLAELMPALGRLEVVR